MSRKEPNQPPSNKAKTNRPKPPPCPPQKNDNCQSFKVYDCNKFNIQSIAAIIIECYCGHKWTEDIKYSNESYSYKILCQKCDNIYLIQKNGNNCRLLHYKRQEIALLEKAFEVACSDSCQHFFDKLGESNTFAELKKMPQAEEKWWYEHYLMIAKEHLK